MLARWDDGYADPWLILTDLESENADILWYRFRSWIECSYRDFKSDGWQWHKTRLQKPDRATSPSRQVSGFLNGLLTIVVRLLMGQSVTLGCLLPNSLSPFNDLSFSNSS